MDVFDTTDLLTTLAFIQETIRENDFTELIWTGDINADFSRKTKYVDIVDNFLREGNLVKSWERFDVDYTHENHVINTYYTSIIDHFFWNECLDTHILDAGVLHLPGNLSDHSPIYCILQNNETLKRNENIKIPKPKPSWKNATVKERNDFFEEMNKRLSSFKEPTDIMKCHDVHCKNACHNTISDEYMLHILQTMEQSAKKVLPTPKMTKKKGNSSKSIPRWKEDIEPYQQDALFWHSIWVSAGKPLNTELHKIMKRTRNIYHVHIRKNKRMLDKIKKDRLLSACLNNANEFFSEIKALRKNKPSYSNVIDGNSENIPEYFSSKYKKLYNSIDDEDQPLRKTSAKELRHRK